MTQITFCNLVNTLRKKELLMTSYSELFWSITFKKHKLTLVSVVVGQLQESYEETKNRFWYACLSELTKE